MMQWQAHRFRGSLVDNSLVEEKELGELGKNVTLLLLFIPTPLLNSFCCIFQPPFISLFIRDGRVIALRKISNILPFIFNNYSSFVNPLLLLILCGDGVYICKIKKNIISCHAVTDKLLVEWLPREL